MSNLPAILNQLGGLPTQGIPQLRSTDMITRVLHTWKLNDLQKISKLESEIAHYNLQKLTANITAMSLMATFGDRMRAEMEAIELNQRNLRAMVRQEESRATILEKEIRQAEAKTHLIENEAKKEEFDFFQYMKSFKNED